MVVVSCCVRGDGEGRKKRALKAKIFDKTLPVQAFASGFYANDWPEGMMTNSLSPPDERHVGVGFLTWNYGYLPDVSGWM